MIQTISSDLPFLLVSIVAGFVLGLLYFWTLWLTAQRLPTSKQPAMLMFGSYFGRTFVLLGSFYLLMDGSWLRLILMLLGFIAARMIMVRRKGQVTVAEEVT
jgi:F1F0 ATPase subunit 2